MVLFLHGGGETGYDNWSQMVNTIGAVEWAKRFPDIYVMAPQAPGIFNESEIVTKSFLKDVNYAPFQAPIELSNTAGFGWNREYLSNVCAIIREMIKEGKVDGKRVYVTGLSMGGGGTLRALAVDRDLFAAAPVCPSMTGETFDIIKSLDHFKIWISTAYVDYNYSRHKYIVDAMMYLKERGNQNARLTLYSHEELAKYGLGCNYELTIDGRMVENHQSWVLTYHNLVFIVLGNILAIFVAILLNIVTRNRTRKVYQTLILIPYLISTVIVSYIVFAFLSGGNGFINKSILSALGKEKISWYSRAEYWPFILTFVFLWKSFGYSSILYFAKCICEGNNCRWSERLEKMPVSRKDTKTDREGCAKAAQK